MNNIFPKESESDHWTTPRSYKQASIMSMKEQVRMYKYVCMIIPIDSVLLHTHSTKGKQNEVVI